MSPASPAASIVGRSVVGHKVPLGFHMIPYDQQYETRDSKYLVSKISDKILMNRKKYVKDFNPYLKSNVSDNLDQSLKDFYNKRYSQR
jgi:hypothetical protein